MIVKNCQVFYGKLIPNRPNDRYNKNNPAWEIQLRTSDPEQKDEWKSKNLNPKLMIHKEGDNEGEPLLDDEGKKQWRVNLKKNSKNRHGEPSDPVEVVNAAKQPVDPGTIGNGSVANIRTFQYEYERDGEERVANVLMGVQLTHHIIYEPAFEDFDDEGKTKITLPEDEEDGDSDTSEEEEEESEEEESEEKSDKSSESVPEKSGTIAKKTKPSAPKSKVPKAAF